MDQERHSRIKTIFLEACARPPSERAAYVAQMCGDDGDLRPEIESLLAFHDEADAQSLAKPPSHDTVEEPIPDAIGPYRVVRKLGEGGMGVVYEVEREEPIRRRLALKVIKLGMDTRETLARFESERQALAMMNHTNIAAVYEAGATSEGRPYFAMEYVEGEPVSAFCDRRRLDTRQRLELFLQICEGVQHAHQKGIIHRDLKPSNVLVTEADSAAVPKIIDFGVAKAIERPLTQRTLFTATGVLIGTPQYMSPEQAELTGRDVDTRSDVYSLGVILYDLLVGVLPFDAATLQQAGFDEIRRIIREQEPPKPSTRVTTLGETSRATATNRGTEIADLRRQLRGDLDWITMKALEKERARRYASVAEFAADLRRHLRDEPVVASPPGTRYRVGKFVRRHRAGVLAGTVVVAALLVGLALSAVGMVRARREAETARRVADLVVGVFADLNPGRVGEHVSSPADFLARGVRRVDNDLGDHPLIQARLLTTLGAAYSARGHHVQARTLLERSLALRLEHLGADHVDTAMSMGQLGDLLLSTGDHEEARRLHQKALDIRQRSLDPDNVMIAWSYRSLGVAYWRLGRFDHARSLLEQAGEITRKTEGPEGLDVANTEVQIAGVETDTGDYGAARPRLEWALAVFEQVLGADHTIVGNALLQLGLLQRRTGEIDAARATLERALAIQEKELGRDHFVVASILHMLGAALIDQGDLEGAQPLLERALGINEGTLGARDSEVSSILTTFGYLFRRRGDLGRARESLQRALALQEETLGPSHYEVSRTLGILARLEAAAGRYPEARALEERAIAIRRQMFPPEHRQLATLLYNLGCIHAMEGERRKALDALREAADCGFASDIVLNDPDLASLRGDPEFEALVSEIMGRTGGPP